MTERYVDWNKLKQSKQTVRVHCRNGTFVGIVRHVSRVSIGLQIAEGLVTLLIREIDKVEET